MSRRLLSLLLSVGFSASALTAQAVTASADPLDRLRDNREQAQDERERVQDDLLGARGDLGHSSRELRAAVAAVTRSRARLDAARDALGDKRAELQVARAVDDTMQRRLAAAQDRLDEARDNLAAGHAQLDDQRDDAMARAAEAMQSPDAQFLELRVLLEARTAEVLTEQLGAADSFADSQARTLDGLEATTVLLTVNAQEVEDAKEQVDEQRAAAALELARRRALEAQAKAARDDVQLLVEQRADARMRAHAARQADLKKVRQLVQDRQRIQDRLQAIARQRAAEIRAQQLAMQRRAERQAALEAAQRAAQQSAQDATHSSEVAAPSTAGSTSATFMVSPVQASVTSPYGMRFHPILRYVKLHDGTDFGAGCGTPVQAATSGQVISRYYNGGYGNRVIIDHGVQRGVSLSTSYNHMESFSTYVGEQVDKGEVIGYVGSTGYSTGCHLHFMVYENGNTVDPMTGWL